MSEQYWIAACPKCGWIGSSKDCAGGGAIADTGDYDDCTCPKCFKDGEWVVVEDAGERMSELESQLAAEREARLKAEAEKLLPLQQKLAGSENMVALQAEAIAGLLKRVDEIEPLQRQVAMLVEHLTDSQMHDIGRMQFERNKEALSNTQAAAEAFVLEIEQRAIERYKLEKP